MEFIAHVDGYYQSDTERDRHDAGLQRALESFQIWGTAFTLAADQWNASLWVKNIFNEEGVTGAFTELYMGTAPAIGYFGNGAKDLISLPRRSACPSITPSEPPAGKKGTFLFPREKGTLPFSRSSFTHD